MRRRVVAAVLLVALAGLLAACGGSAFDSQPPGSIAEEYSLSGPQGTAQFTVGSKDFTEQLVLGQITVQALEAAGGDVIDQTNTGDTEATRQALTTGQIDMYWEYTGTGWLIHLAELDPGFDGQELYEAVAEADRQNGVEWLPPGPANNTYTIAVREEAYEDLGVQNISDLGELLEEDPQEATLCLGAEFRNRADALPGLEEAYGFEFPPENLVELPDPTVYQAVANGGRCNFGSVFETDGRVPELGLRLIEDDEGFFSAYNPSLNVDEETLGRYPELADLFAPIAERLDTGTLQSLSAAVDVEGETPEAVATGWLQENGFVG